ncbi:protein OXIDATIVE STRESS 3-like [Mercurialis annua]|uniref:protein OXIDATIVE STRESS 3-like n=1 Tax=Mercurialis annua TaxID=3986 RepID=UPI00215E8A9C|nr:protein OXIDATIVE STRESS 3-like [Mercurialis annua]
MENSSESMIFDMEMLRNNLPKKRGLSRYYSGKSRSFTCMADVHCLEDLKKKENPDAKKRKKYSDKKDFLVPPHPCRRVSSTTHCASLYAGV